jgi:hypothetical protein
MDTGVLRVEIWKDYDTAVTQDDGLSGQIAYLEATIPSTKYEGGSLSDFSMAATLRTVQEGEEHTFRFKTAHVVPSQAAITDKLPAVVPGIHIVLPPTMRVDLKAGKPNGTPGLCTITPGPESLADPAQKFTASAAKVTLDESSDYDSICQTQLCLIIGFKSDTPIAAGA